MKYIAAAGMSLALTAVASAAPPIEAYGELPEISAVAISPDGTHFAFIRRQNDEEYFVVKAIGGDIVGAGKGDFKARWTSFADNQHAIFRASETTRSFGFRGEWENSGAISFNLETKKLKLLLNGTEGLFPAQSGLGRIVGLRNGTNDVFIPAYAGPANSDPSLDLFAVDLDSGRGKSHAKGNPSTRDWFVDEDGTILAREDFREQDQLYRIFTRKNGALEKIYEETNVSIPSLAVIAVASDKSALIVGTKPEGEQFDRVARLGFDGRLSPPLYETEGRDVEHVVTTQNRVAFGVKFSGMTPKYQMNEPALNATMADLAEMYGDASVHLTDWTDDFKQLLVFIEGGPRSPGYYILDTDKRTISRIASSYPAIEDDDVGIATAIEYKARDGRKIPAVLTLPPGAELGKTLPMIVMPHGGPEAYDQIGFDYLAQYFASRGYLVFQPNFRGSAGFGLDHLEAGYGEWGGKMQDDVTDGVNLLVRRNWADGARVCIVGGSYGGYAALAGGAFTPDLYKCVAAIAPVSDLSAMLIEARTESGKDSITYAYWTKLIGDRREDKQKINAISPVNAGANFKAPVLLLHGDDDTVVPFSQSAKMESALKKAGKNVRLVKLKGEDHWLSSSETRLQALRELDAFVAEHLGGN
ncbi:MAG: alpha/beta hydrolase family protein [Pseudomonadota bacterium]